MTVYWVYLNQGTVNLCAWQQTSFLPEILSALHLLQMSVLSRLLPCKPTLVRVIALTKQFFRFMIKIPGIHSHHPLAIFTLVYPDEWPQGYTLHHDQSNRCRLYAVYLLYVKYWVKMFPVPKIFTLRWKPIYLIGHVILWKSN